MTARARKDAGCLLGRQPGTQEETRWRLLQAADEVFAEVGYHAATMREICKRAGVNLASIHHYFGDKAALRREVFRLPFLDECNTFATLDYFAPTAGQRAERARRAGAGGASKQARLLKPALTPKSFLEEATE